MMFGRRYPHPIRLRGPWEIHPDDPAAPPARIAFPFSWKDLPSIPLGEMVRFRRRFGYPGKIDAEERVWLTLAACGPHAEIHLNEASLGVLVSGEGEFEVGDRLLPRNLLEIVMRKDDQPRCDLGQVALEVRQTAFLRGAALVKGADETRVQGLVVGAADRALELYCLVDGEQAHYRLIEPTPQGTPFDLVLPTGSFRTLKLELVNVSSIWYSVQMLGSL